MKLENFDDAQVFYFPLYLPLLVSLSPPSLSPPSLPPSPPPPLSTSLPPPLSLPRESRWMGTFNSALCHALIHANARATHARVRAHTQGGMGGQGLAAPAGGQDKYGMLGLLRWVACVFARGGRGWRACVRACVRA